MANFIPSKHTANEYNNGVQYVNELDSVQAETVNNLVESALYTQEQAQSAKNLVNSVVVNAFAPPLVGMHHIQFYGEPTPAEIWGGTTWVIDTDYQGRTIIGSGGDYALGATGGSETHTHEAGNLYGCIKINTYKQISIDNVASSNWTSNRTLYTNDTLEDVSAAQTTAARVGGTTASGNNVPPYVVVNYWKRTA